MTDAKHDVLGIGNAIFDVLVKTDEAFLSRHGMTKGSMALIDEAKERRELCPDRGCVGCQRDLLLELLLNAALDTVQTVVLTVAGILMNRQQIASFSVKNE